METPRTCSETWTVARLLAWTRDYFQRNGLESPRLCAELLLAHALECERLELYTRHELEPGPETLERFRESVRQAAAGRPIAYITGVKDFFSLTFEVNPDVLVPRPETEVLVERTIQLARRPETPLRRILDLGAGSGCIAIALARHLPDATIFASDVSETALAVARRNAERLGVAGRLELRCGDLMAPWADAAPFDAIVTNPPYIGEDEADTLPPAVRDYEPRVALFAGADGLATFRRLLAAAPQRLADGGHLLAEMAYNQASRIRALFDPAVWQAVTTYRDHLQHERVVHARLRRRASPEAATEGSDS